MLPGNLAPALMLRVTLLPIWMLLPLKTALPPNVNVPEEIKSDLPLPDSVPEKVEVPGLHVNVPELAIWLVESDPTTIKEPAETVVAPV